LTPSKLFDLSGSVAVVTGASGTLGRTFAVTLAEAGAKVALVGRDAEALEATREAITAVGGTAAITTADVTRPGAVNDMYRTIESTIGTPTVLINNAGTVNQKYAADLTAADWDSVMNVNLRGAFLVAQGFGRRRIAAGGGGAVVNIASITGITAPATIAPYAVSKAGLIQLTRVLAREWARYNIRVNALCPGYFESNMNQGFLKTEAGQRMIQMHPLRRIGRTEELSGALLLLASDAGSYINGVSLVVDGGQVLVTP